jgi:hypothetical protein
VKLSAVKRPFAILAMLLLAWTQCFGVGAGFLCFCSGKPVQTLMDHCHGPHGAACMESHTPHYHHHDGEHHDDSDTERHVSVNKDINLQSLGPQLAAPVYVAVIVAVLPLATSIEAESGLFHLHEASRPPPESSHPGIRLPHTVALLI